MDGERLTGRLLVAAPALSDPHFDRTVVYLLDHDDDGALGVVLNRPTEVGVPDALPDWVAAASEPAVVHAGGPVQRQAAVCLARLRPGATLDGFAAVDGGLGTLDLGLDPALAAPALDGLRVYAGYAGWGPGQLEGELAADAWFVVDAWPTDPFDPHPRELWRAVLRRQPGRLRLLATFPADPSQN